MKSWKDSDISALVRWMEDRQELLRGSTAAWTKQAAEELFPDQADIDALKIKRKFHNMKRQWGEAKKMHKESGFGVREKDCEVSINAILNKKCPYFWRLDNMFGAWPNNVVIRTTDSRPSQPSHLTPVQETEETSELVESDQDAEGDDNHLLALANSTPLPSSRRKRKADSSAQENRIDDLQRVLEADRRFYQQQEDKRQKLQGDIQLQIARIHAESQERLMESQRRFMEQQLQALQQFMGSIIHSLHRPH